MFVPNRNKSVGRNKISDEEMKRRQKRKERLAAKVKQSYIEEYGEEGTPEEMAQHGRDEEIVNVKDAWAIEHYFAGSSRN